MPITISPCLDKGYVEIKWQGLVTDNQIVTQRMKYLVSADYIPGTHELVDVSEADLSEITLDGLRQVAQISSDIYKFENEDKIKLAFFAPDMAVFAVTHVYEHISDNKAENVKVFTDKQEAERWILSAES